MKRAVTILLIIVVIVCFGIAISYPLRYSREKAGNEEGLEGLRAMRAAGLTETDSPVVYPEQETPTPVSGADAGNEAQTERPDTTAVSGDTHTPVPESTAHVPYATAAFTQTALPAAETPGAATETPSPATEAPYPVAEAPTDGPEVTPKPRETEAISGLVPLKEPTPTPEPTCTPTPEPTPVPTATPIPTATPEPTPVPTRVPYTGALAYPNKEKVVFEESRILPQYREIYALNHDLVGWLVIPGVGVDHPVMQNPDDEYYLHHDFYGKSNQNGQLLIFNICDVFTPSYNVVISGHNMNSGKMFGELTSFARRSFWEKHKTFTFDTLLREGTYVVVAAFYSANYDEDEEGFRYLADVQYPIDYRYWIEEVRRNAIYDTGIDTEFGDEFVTLTTCAYQRRNGRFVVIARRLREGESLE